MSKLTKLIAFARFAVGEDYQWGPIATPIDVIAQQCPAGCGDNGEACIQCYGCLHQSIDMEPQGGLACLAGPWDDIEARPYYKEWCMTTPGHDYTGLGTANYILSIYIIEMTPVTPF